jgi:hypothetical protein
MLSPNGLVGRSLDNWLTNINYYENPVADLTAHWGVPISEDRFGLQRGQFPRLSVSPICRSHIGRGFWCPRSDIPANY